MASSQDEARGPSSGSSSKAMKLLGLSKLPPDASRSDHLSLIRQHRSVRKERAKSSSPLSLNRGDSASRLTSYGGGSSSTMTGGGGTPMPHHAGGGGGHEQYLDEDAGRGGGGGSDSEDEEEGMMPHQRHHHRRQQNSEWLDMRESSLKLTPADLDEQFLQTITGLMGQFPEPPNPDSITELNSPATAAFGRRGLHISKPGSHRRGGGGGGGGGSGEVALSRQNPMYQLQVDNKRGGGVRELESPMRIRYNKPEEQFSL